MTYYSQPYSYNHPIKHTHHHPYLSPCHYSYQPSPCSCHYPYQASYQQPVGYMPYFPTGQPPQYAVPATDQAALKQKGHGVGAHVGGKLGPVGAHAGGHIGTAGLGAHVGGKLGSHDVGVNTGIGWRGKRKKK